MSTTPRTRSVLPALAGTGILLCGAGLTACGSDDDTAAGNTASAGSTVTVTAAPPQATVTVTPGGGDGGNGGGSDDCSGLTAREAVDRWASEVPLPEEGYPYAPGAATLETYEPCAALSWMVLPVAHATASSPNQIMLFHHGGYIGTATSKVYGFTPDVIRVDDDSVQVTWHWPQDGDPNARPTGRSTAQFVWDDGAGKVVMTGEVPPV